MVRALWWKEWRQLNLLRVSGLVAGLLLPPMLLAAAAAASRGWLFLQPMSSATPSVVLGEALPLLLAFAIWPLFALLTAAQAFTADRSAGTESFLLERPVPRARVWRTRLLAAATTLLLIFASQLAVWGALALGFVAAGGFSPSSMLSVLAVGGLIAAVVFLAGVAAAPFVRTPVQALLGGAVLGALPLGLSSMMNSAFPRYGLDGLSLAGLPPVLLLVAYGASAFRMSCRGEPAGTGRWRRGIVILVTALAAVPLTFALSAPLVLRWDAKLGVGNSTVVPSPAGHRVLIRNDRQGAGWLVDSDTGERLRFFPPPLWDAGWNDDGSRVAVIHAAGPLGHETADQRIEVYDASGDPVGRSVRCAECIGWLSGGIHWSGDTIVARSYLRNTRGLVIIPPDGERRLLELPEPARHLEVVQARATRELFALTFDRAEDPVSDRSTDVFARLHPLDVETATLGAPIPLGRVDSFWYALRGLSPRGRYWVRHPAAPSSRLEILDLHSGGVTTLDGRRAVWVGDDDRLAWTRIHDRGEVELMLGRPGGVPRSVRVWSGIGLWVTASPVGNRLVVTVRRDEERSESWIYDPAADRWRALPTDPDGSTWFAHFVQWADADTLALPGPGFIELQRLDGPEAGRRMLLFGDD